MKSAASALPIQMLKNTVDSFRLQHPVSVQNELSLISPLSSRKALVTNYKIAPERKRVRFASHSETVYFLSSRPPSKTKNPILTLEVEPVNCADIVNNGSWLSDVNEMRKEPFCRLDYLRATEEVDTSPASQVFHLDGDEEFEVSDASEYNLEGELAVYNLDFYKKVYVHYSFDDWKSNFKISAKYCSSVGTLRIDKFHFSIVTPDLGTTSFPLQLAIEYQVNGNCHWDNLHGRNYQFTCQKVPLDTIIIPPKNNVAEETLLALETLSVTIPIPVKRSPNRQINHFVSSLPTEGDSWSRALDIPRSIRSSLESAVELPHRAASWDCTKSFTLLAMANNISPQVEFFIS
jgi:hypothetical protein